jgi:hypothetical protein
MSDLTPSRLHAMQERLEKITWHGELNWVNGRAASVAVADLALRRGRVESRGGGPMTAPAPPRCEGGKA